MMLPLLKSLISFGLIGGAALTNGKLARDLKLPMISGFLITGILAGPSVLGFISSSEVQMLQPVDHVALGMIAINAGSELYLKALNGRWGSILAVMLGLVFVTLGVGAGVTFLLRDHISFLQGHSAATAAAISILIGTIMIARSPSAAIAIINELSAKGPFTQLILGVTVLMDVVVIILFALALSVAHNLIEGQAFSQVFIAEVGLELIASLALGLLLAIPIQLILRARRQSWLRPMSLVGSSCFIFFLADQLHHMHINMWGASLHIEPLIACLTLGVWINNASAQREELDFDLHRLSLLVYLTFFTITGASLKLELLIQMWQVALLLFVIRLIGIGLGAAIGGVIAGEPQEQHRYRWMGFVTQAGVGLGLAQRVASDFPGWGDSFAALMIAVIVINEMVGPLFFKYAITRSGEAHVYKETHSGSLKSPSNASPEDVEESAQDDVTRAASSTPKTQGSAVSASTRNLV